MPTPAIRVALAAAAVISASGLAACASAHHTPPAAPPPRAAAATQHAVTQHAVTRHAVTRHTVLQFVSTDEPGNMTLEDLGAKSAPGGPDLGDLLAFTQTLTRGRQTGRPGARRGRRRRPHPAPERGHRHHHLGRRHRSNSPESSRCTRRSP